MRVLISPITFLFIVTLFRRACTVNRKLRDPIDLNLAASLPEGIATIQSEMPPIGTYYYVKTTYSRLYRMGLIRFGGNVFSKHTWCTDDMIMKGNEDDMNRFLFYALLERGVRYLRIVSKYIRFGKPAREVAEFIQRPGEGRYTRLVRKTVDIEVITQQNTRTIQVEEGSATKARRFSVRKEMKLEASIGVVRYCCYVVNAKVHGLIERKVIWEGGHDAPVITVISLYSEGYCLTTKHVFKGIGRGFRMENRVWTPIFLSPKDEGMYNEHAEAPQSCPVSRATENEDQEPCTSESVIKFSGRPVPEVIADSTTQEGASVQEFNPPVPDLTVPAQIHPGDVESVQLAISSSSYDESDWDSSD